MSDLLKRSVAAVRHIEQFLTPQDDWVEAARRRLFVVLHLFARLPPLKRPLIREKSRRDYVATVQAPSDAVERALMSGDNVVYQRNLVSTRKYRVVDGDRQWADGSFVYDPPDTNWQHHVYLLDKGNGTTDIYAHEEPSAEYDPEGHVSGDQVHGDPRGLARGKCDRAGLQYT